MAMRRDEDEAGPVAVNSGPLTIDQAAELKSALVALLEEPGDHRVRLEQAAVVDLTGFQVFCSAHRTAIENGSRLELLGDPPACVGAIAGEAGPCTVRDRDGGYCFWRGAVNHG